MAYIPHVLIQFGGVWSSTDMVNESWSCTLRGYCPEGGGHLLNPQGYADACSGALSSWFSTAANNQRSDAKLTYLKTNNIGTDGKYSDTITAMHPFTTGVSGGGGTPGTAFMCLAYTFETGITIGLAKRGRMYTVNAVSIDVGGGNSCSVTTVARDAARTAAKNLLNCFAVIPPGQTLKFRPAVISKTAGKFNDITGITVSSVADVQRRRKKQATDLRSAVLAFP